MGMDTCTLDDLIAALQEAKDEHGGDVKVVFTSNYGDRARTQQAHRLYGRVEETQLVESAYSDSGYAVADSDEGMHDEYTERKVLVIE